MGRVSGGGLRGGARLILNLAFRIPDKVHERNGEPSFPGG